MAALHAARGGMAQHKNIIGPQLRKIRCQRELTQNDLAAKLQLAGWWIDRAGLSKIEAGLVRVNDYLKVSERQIRNFIARKLLRKSKAQAKTLIPGEDVETLLTRTS